MAPARPPRQPAWSASASSPDASPPGHRNGHLQLVKSEPHELELDGHRLRITHPDKPFFEGPAFPSPFTKLDLVRYILEVSDGALRGVARRPTVLKRFPDGAAAPFFFQKRVPPKRPDWLQTATIRFPSGRSAEELCPVDRAHLIWAVNLGCLGFDPWAVRREDLDHPDELRIDLDPQEGVPFSMARETAALVREVLEEHHLTGFPKTSGMRGIHVLVRIRPEWDFTEVRHAALALAREVERRAPRLATSAWWKEQRGQRVFLDYNQNARDRTVVSAYSVRPHPEARVSFPLHWDELEQAEPGDFNVRTVPALLARRPDAHAAIDARAFGLESLLALFERQRTSGAGEAPFPPHFPKAPGEPHRAAPSRSRRPAHPD